MSVAVLNTNRLACTGWLFLCTFLFPFSASFPSCYYLVPTHWDRLVYLLLTADRLWRQSLIYIFNIWNILNPSFVLTPFKSLASLHWHIYSFSFDISIIISLISWGCLAFPFSFYSDIFAPWSYGRSLFSCSVADRAKELWWRWDVQCPGNFDHLLNMKLQLAKCCNTLVCHLQIKGMDCLG